MKNPKFQRSNQIPSLGSRKWKMAKSLKKWENFFLQPSHVGTLSRRAEKPDGMQKELVHFDVLELRKRPKTVLKQ